MWRLGRDDRRRQRADRRGRRGRADGVDPGDGQCRRRSRSRRAVPEAAHRLHREGSPAADGRIGEVVRYPSIAAHQHAGVKATIEAAPAATQGRASQWWPRGKALANRPPVDEVIAGRWAPPDLDGGGRRRHRPHQAHHHRGQSQSPPPGIGGGGAARDTQEIAPKGQERRTAPPSGRRTSKAWSRPRAAPARGEQGHGRRRRDGGAVEVLTREVPPLGLYGVSEA